MLATPVAKLKGRSDWTRVGREQRGWVAVAVIGQDNNQAKVSGLNATSFPHHHAWLSLPAAPPVGPVRNSTAHDAVFCLSFYQAPYTRARQMCSFPQWPSLLIRNTTTEGFWSSRPYTPHARPFKDFPQDHGVPIVRGVLLQWHIQSNWPI